jgi:hypothetical protein
MARVTRADAYRRTLRGMEPAAWDAFLLAECLPGEGRAYLERWLDCRDPDVRWIVRANLRKGRLKRLDPAWVARCVQTVG